MKYQGQIVNWNDEKGFGFVEPNGGGRRAFVHISAFAPQSHRPADGDVIVYTEVTQADGRTSAANIRYGAARRLPEKKKARHAGPGIWLTLLFCIFLPAAYLAGHISVAILAAYLLLSIITFVAYALDKSAARHNRRRTRERTLHLLGAVGGWPGAYFARQWLRHKSSKLSFIRTFWLSAIVNVMALFWLSGSEQRQWLRSLPDLLLTNAGTWLA